LAREDSGSVWCRLRIRTCDFATASRATRRCEALPTSSRWVRSVNGCSKRPSSNFAVRIRDTASSIRLMGTTPSSTSWVSVSMNCGYPTVSPENGSMNMSTPALTEVATCVA
jgi:hypothetical protein